MSTENRDKYAELGYANRTEYLQSLALDEEVE